MRSEAWRALVEDVAKEDARNAEESRSRLSKPGLAKAEWSDETDYPAHEFDYR